MTRWRAWRPPGSEHNLKPEVHFLIVSLNRGVEIGMQFRNFRLMLNLTIAGVLVILFFNGCGSLQLDRNINQFHRTSWPSVVDHSPSTRSPFVGVAISGGGSRSANFAAAVLEELDYYGFLDHVNAISAVSGGTLPAAYYVLNRKKPAWSWNTLRERVGTNFYSHLLLKHANPWKLLNYAFTEYNRSDMMAEVFDETLLDNATFGDIDAGMPELLINATDVNGGPFVFSKMKFDEMHSSFTDYPVSRALAASTSVPGIFQGIAVRTYQADGTFYYYHLIDGGITENLGLESLFNHYIRSEESVEHGARSASPRACFIFLIDASPGGNEAQRLAAVTHRDLRKWSDFIVDRNLMNAFDVMFGRAYGQFLFQIQEGRDLGEPIYEATYKRYYNQMKCTIWQIHSRYLMYDNVRFDKSDNYKIAAHLHSVLPQIETHWKLVSPIPCSSTALQAALYDGAKMLVSASRFSLSQAMAWFASHHLPVKQGLPPRSESYEFFPKYEVAVTNEEKIAPGEWKFGEIFCKRK
ncbi:MAG TPA: patatin-like phospholipase family protein [Nitrospira sp.]|nr:patatin-like phospholipase family protein [Nitrospira sp.]